ncbi:endonuclease/exonuclease/phosphatase family protein [Streptomyces sp. H10-C2]|nr:MULTISPECIES: endonuclease/exonuclease/phosphatase family protein [unclassified Streptomyces]MDJ0345480.1 endonuclease/exonuclease/phosphatase family protein [Streptomyces sp. PH10-H1]MDJ0371846.1 endonuclease/exonuclease/phosphatase family protein [Streptomyces sp. H10-C2]
MPQSANANAGTTASAADGVRIHDIQGATRISPLSGQAVSAVPGIVTGVRAYGSSKGFWIQDPTPDEDPATSEGVFVFTSASPTVAIGDSVLVSGTVSEFYPGGKAAGGQSVTEITKPVVTVVSSGNALPAPVVLDNAAIPAAYTPAGDPAATNSIEALPLRPATYALDLYESLEGMNVLVADARVVGATDPYSELWVTVKPQENPSPRGGTVYGSYTGQNSGRLQIQSLIPTAQQPFPAANVGDVLTGTTEGPLDFNQFGGYTLAARAIGTVKNNGLQPETTRKQKNGELAVATYNVQNLDPSDPQAKFDRLAAGVVTHLASPDIVALEEIQDNNGAVNDGTVAADKTVGQFIDAIVAAGGPRYQWRSIDPTNGTDGGEPGGNIRQVFLFNADRVSFTDRPGGDATTPVWVANNHGKAALSVSPGRIAPGDTAWADSRKPLAGEFTFRGKPVIVIANHFASKGGDNALTSRFQPVVRSSETKRLQQAVLVNTFVHQIQAVQKEAKVVVLGDINDYEFSAAGLRLTEGRALKDLVLTLCPSERYSYVFQGNSQVLDHILVSPSLGSPDYDVVHINAEFADQASDHDPQIVRIKP